MLKVINLFAGPGAGKSTTAAGLFHLMKLEGMDDELVTEYAKDMTWEQRHNVLSDQCYMFAKQHRRIHRLEGDVEWVVTDSPLLLSLIYAPKDYPFAFSEMVRAFWRRFENHCFFIDRVKPYKTAGRNQTAEEAKALDLRVRDLLTVMHAPFSRVPGDRNAPRAIFDMMFAEPLNAA